LFSNQRQCTENSCCKKPKKTQRKSPDKKFHFFSPFQKNKHVTKARFFNIKKRTLLSKHELCSGPKTNKFHF